MTTPSVISFCIAAFFYALTWVYIRQLVRDVNSEATEQRIPLWRWRKGWSRHQALFPNSGVRKRLAGCMALTLIFGLIAFAIAVAQNVVH